MKILPLAVAACARVAVASFEDSDFSEAHEHTTGFGDVGVIK